MTGINPFSQNKFILTNSGVQNNLADKTLMSAYSSKIQIPPDNFYYKQVVELAKKYEKNPNIAKITACGPHVSFHFKSGVVVEKGIFSPGDKTFTAILPNKIDLQSLEGDSNQIFLGSRYGSPFMAHANFRLRQKANYYEGFDPDINEKNGYCEAYLKFEPLKTSYPSPINGKYIISVFDRKKNETYELLSINPDGTYTFAKPALHKKLKEFFYKKWYDMLK